MTALFLPAFQILIIEEGRYANVQGDSGGETYAGVSRNNFPTWTGWQKVDAAKQSGNDLKSDQVFQSLQEDLAQFYNQKFWIPSQAGNLNSQALANFYLGCCVNMGQHEAVKLLQRALGFQGVDVDGLIGHKTIAAANSLPGTLNAYCDVTEGFYLMLAQTHPEDEKFLNGWNARVDKYREA